MNCAGLVKYENHTHVKKMGHTLEFLFGIYWWTWKTTFKKMLKWTNKKCKNFNIYSVARKTPSFYTCVPKILIWYTVLDIECNQLKLVIMGHYLPFYTPSSKPKKSKEKTIAGDIIILHKCAKNHNHMRYSSWDTMRQIKIFVI